MSKYLYRGGYRDELREKRKRRKIRVAFLVVSSSITLTVFIVYALFFSGWFSIRGIQVSGNQEIKAQEIQNLAESHINRAYFLGYIRPFLNILFASSDDIEYSLNENFPVIKTVDVNKNFFSRRLNIKVNERQAAGIWCRDDSNKCFYFDGDGILFKSSPRFSGEVFLTIEDGRGRDFNLTDSFDDKELLEKINSAKNILDELKVVTYNNFFLPPGSFEFWVKTKEGWNIYLDKENDISTQLVALKKFLDEKLSSSRRQTLEYIDLRVNNRIYYK